jgi:hypothetical protein
VYALDPERSSIILRTRAGGLFSVVAHDLELTAKATRGQLKNDGDNWDGEIAIEPASIRVVGAIKKGAVDRKVLSPSDVRDIEQRIANDIFGGVREIVVRARGNVKSPVVRIEGKRESIADLRVTENNRVFTARGSVSIKGLGLAEVKGPLGAFVIKDAVEVDATIAFL